MEQTESMSLDDLINDFKQRGDESAENQQDVIKGETETVENGGEPSPKPNTEISENQVETPEFFNDFEKRFFENDLLRSWQLEDGSWFTPKNDEELSELIKANIDSARTERIYEEKNEALQQALSESTPAFQFLVSNANKFRTIEDMLPLIENVNLQEQIDNLDLENPEHQELIVRNALSLKGFPQSDIDSDIQDFKERTVLGKKAESLKPILDEFNSIQRQRIIDQENKKLHDEMVLMNNYFSLINTDIIQSKDIDGLKIDQNIKERVISYLVPQENSSEIPLYQKIDESIAKGDITNLFLVSLLLDNKEAFFNLIGNRSATKVAKELQKVIRTNNKTSYSSSEPSDTTYTQQNAKGVSQFGSFI